MFFSPTIYLAGPQQTVLNTSLEFLEMFWATAMVSSWLLNTTPTVSGQRRVTVPFSGSNPPPPLRTHSGSLERPPHSLVPEVEALPPRRAWPSAPQDLLQFPTSAWTAFLPSRSHSGSRLSSPTCVGLPLALRARHQQHLLLSFVSRDWI